MNRPLIVSISAGLVALLSLVIDSEAQHQRDHSLANDGVPVESHRDHRMALAIGSAAEAGLKLTMREHLEALHDVIAALGRKEFEQAAKVARDELGFLKHHNAMKRETGATFPPKYHELAMAHHQAAEDLATVIPSKDIEQILSHVGETILACVNCHQAFRL